MLEHPWFELWWGEKRLGAVTGIDVHDVHETAAPGGVPSRVLGVELALELLLRRDATELEAVTALLKKERGRSRFGAPCETLLLKRGLPARPENLRTAKVLTELQGFEEALCGLAWVEIEEQDATTVKATLDVVLSTVGVVKTRYVGLEHLKALTAEWLGLDSLKVAKQAPLPDWLAHDEDRDE